MIKNTLLLAALASLVSFSACKKEEKKDAETAPKTTEAAADKADKAAPTPDKAPAADEAAAADKAAPAPAAAAAGDMSREEVAEKAVALFTKLNETVKGANGDCAKVATGLTTVLTEGKSVMEAGKKFDQNEEDKKWFEETHGEKVKGLMGEMLGALSPCMEDAAVQKALEGLN